MASKTLVLPLMAPFPEALWREHLVPEEWEACLDAWISLAEAHLSLSAADFARLSTRDASLPTFLLSFLSFAVAEQTSKSHDALWSSNHTKAKRLRKHAFLLSYRLLETDHPPEQLLRWEFLADTCAIYGKSNARKLVTVAWKRHPTPLEVSIGSVKIFLTRELDAGLKDDLKTAEAQLKRMNHLLHAFPEASTYFMAGSDFLDSLISCYKLMNPPLRKAILSSLYLCLIGLTEGGGATFSVLVDQLYSMKTAAEAHKAGPTNVNDSLVAELVTATPILKQVRQKIHASGSGSSRAESVIAALDGFRKHGGTGRPYNRKITKTDRSKGKGKGIAKESEGQIQIDRMKLISQVQDLFPDLGSGFVVKLLDEYDENVENIIKDILEGSLPSHLEKADRSEDLNARSQLANDYTPNIAPQSTAQLPSRRNVFDDDEFDQLAVSASRLILGRRDPDRTADDVLEDRSNAPNKAAILSALNSFDSDDDEYDDTYDAEDVGGTVDSAAPGNNIEDASAEVRDGKDNEILFRAYKATPAVFSRDAATRRSKPRMAIKEETGLTDEAIEGWGLMLSRDPRQMRRLEATFSTFTGGQKELASTAWRASPAGSGTENSDADRNRGRGGFRGGGRGRGRGRGGVSGPTGDKDTEVARHRKEANKGSRANHNRRDQRARKMARGGFPG